MTEIVELAKIQIVDVIEYACEVIVFDAVAQARIVFNDLVIVLS